MTWLLVRNSNGHRLALQDPELRQLLRIQQNRDWPAVHQFNFHRLLEAAGLAAQPQRANTLHEARVQLPRTLRPCGRIERWPFAAPDISKQRELRNRQYRSAYLRHAEVHLPCLILKDP